MINADGQSLDSVLEKTALVAGWVPRGREQMCYIKAVSQRCIVASRVVEGKICSIDRSIAADPKRFYGEDILMKEKKKMNDDDDDYLWKKTYSKIKKYIFNF